MGWYEIGYYGAAIVLAIAVYKILFEKQDIGHLTSVFFVAQKGKKGDNNGEKY